MAQITLITDDIIQADRYGIPIIVQQCNCVTLRPLGLALQIANQLNVNTYSLRRPSSLYNRCLPTDESQPGTISIHSSNKSLLVANLYAQIGPGKPGKYHLDTYVNRKQWFDVCLKELHRHLTYNSINRVAFPYGIGCGLAGGKWEDYFQMIQMNLPGIQVLIFQLN